MTDAPADLLAVRKYLLGVTGLPGDAVGIVGDPAHAATGGYHEGNDDLARVGRLDSDYSKRESPRDRPGTNDASALDLGQWSGRRGAAGLTWLQYNARLAELCRAGHPLTRDIREVIYTGDGTTVRRWDALGIRSTGDSSHLSHTHRSYFRDSVGRRTADLDRLILDGEGSSMSVWDEQIGAGFTPGGPAYGDNLFRTAIGYTWYRADEIKGLAEKIVANQAADAARDAAVKAAIDGLVLAIHDGGGNVDAVAIKAAIVDAVHDAVGPLQALVADLQHRLAEAERAAGVAAGHAIDGQ